MEYKNRKHLRLQEYDYNTQGAYFLTFCTYNRKNTLSRIVGAIHESPKSVLTRQGQIVDEIIQSIPQHIGVTLDRYVIMPNHIHLVLVIEEEPRAIHESPLRKRSAISNAIGYIKMNASKRIHQDYGNTQVWQRGFYDHVIRNERDYLEIAKYIEENPLRWQLDCYYESEEL